MAILQSFQVAEPVNQIQPFDHYKGKTNQHGYTVSATPLLTLNYIELIGLPGSQAEAALTRMVAIERSFQSVVNHIPVQLSINKQPRAPMSWSVMYLFPEGNLEGFLSTQFESSVEQLAYANVGLLSWSLQATLSYTMFGTCATRPRIEGYQLSDLDVQISATTDYEIANYGTPDGVPTEGLLLPVNPHTLHATVNQTEDTSLVRTWQYSWSFGVN